MFWNYSLILFSLMMRISLEVYEFNYELFDYEVTNCKSFPSFVVTQYVMRFFFVLLETRVTCFLSFLLFLVTEDFQRILLDILYSS